MRNFETAVPVISDLRPTALAAYKNENITRVRPRAYVGAVSGLERSYRAQRAAKRYGHTLASAFGMIRASKRAVLAVR